MCNEMITDHLQLILVVRVRGTCATSPSCLSSSVVVSSRIYHLKSGNYIYIYMYV